MPFPQSALEQQLRKPGKTSTGWPWQLFIFSSVALAISFFIYTGMIIGYKPYLESQIADRDKKISTLDLTISGEQKKNLFNFYSQLINIKNLIASHQVASKIVDALEKNTHPNVYFTSARLSLTNKSLDADGVATGLDVLAQQMKLLGGIDGVQKVFLKQSQIAGNSNNINFTISLDLNPKIFKP